MNRYVHEIRREKNVTINIFQLYGDSIIFKVTPDVHVSDMEGIVNRFEQWIENDDRINYIHSIKFVGEHTRDTMLANNDELYIEFRRQTSEVTFDRIIIGSVVGPAYNKFLSFAEYDLNDIYIWELFGSMDFSDCNDFSSVERLIYHEENALINFDSDSIDVEYGGER